MPVIQPVWADLIPDSMGVNVHYSFATTVYGNSSAVTSLVKDLKVRHVRDRMSPNPGLQRTQFGVLKAAGIKAHVTMGVYNQTDQSDVNALCTAIALDPDRFSSVGGCNEPNAEPAAANWATLAKNQQQMIYETMVDYGLGSIPVVAPSLKDNVSNLGNDYSEIQATGIGAYCDKADYHKYPLGGGGVSTPSNGHQQRIDWAVAAYGGPCFCTETGMNNMSSKTPEWVTGIYAPRLQMETFYRGVERTFMYELLDDPDSSGTTLEAHFGLVRTPPGSLNDPSQWVKKPAFYSLQELSATLADPGAPVTPITINLTVSGGGSDLRWVCAGKRDGSYFLILWRDTAVYNHSTSSQVNVTAQTISITSPFGTQQVQLAGTLIVVNLGTGEEAPLSGGGGGGDPEEPPPPDPDPGGGGGGGGVVVVNPNPPTVTAGWSDPYLVSEPFDTGIPEFPTDDWSEYPGVLANSDGTATVVWRRYTYDETDEWWELWGAIVAADGTVSDRQILYTSNSASEIWFPRHWEMGDNILYMWDESSPVTRTLWFLIAPDLSIVGQSLITAVNFIGSDSHITKIDDTTLLVQYWSGSATVVYEFTIGGTISYTLVTSNLNALFSGSTGDILWLDYDIVEQKGIATLATGVDYFGGVYEWSWTGSAVTADSSLTAIDDPPYDFDGTSMFRQGRDGHLYFWGLQEENPGDITDDRWLYNVTFGPPDVTPWFNTTVGVIEGVESMVYYFPADLFENLDTGVLIYKSVVDTTDTPVEFALYHLDGDVMTASDPPDPQNMVTISADNLADLVWVAYWYDTASAETASQIYIRLFGGGEIPNLSGEFEEKRRVFPRSPTKYSP